MGSTGEESIVINLVGIPTPETARLATQTSGKKRNARHLYLGCILPRARTQRLVGRQRINGLDACIVVHAGPVEADPDGVDHCRIYNVAFLQGHSLPSRVRAQEHIVEAVGKGEGSVVV